jgi:hypothetical protein
LLSNPSFEYLTPAELKTHLTEVLAHRDIVTNIPKWAGGEDKNRLLFLGEIQKEEQGDNTEDDADEEQIKFTLKRISKHTLKKGKSAKKLFW